MNHSAATPRQILTIAITAALVALIPSMIGLYLFDREADQRIAAVRELDAQNDRVRRQLVRGFKRADVITCREVESLKAQVRRDAIQDHDELQQTLDLIGVESTPAIVQRAQEEMEETLREYRSRKGGCGTLPPPFGG